MRRQGECQASPPLAPSPECRRPSASAACFDVDLPCGHCSHGRSLRRHLIHHDGMIGLGAGGVIDCDLDRCIGRRGLHGTLLLPTGDVLTHWCAKSGEVYGAGSSGALDRCCDHVGLSPVRGPSGRATRSSPARQRRPDGSVNILLSGEFTRNREEPRNMARGYRQHPTGRLAGTVQTPPRAAPGQDRPRGRQARQTASTATSRTISAGPRWPPSSAALPCRLQCRSRPGLAAGARSVGAGPRLAVTSRSEAFGTQ
jgi:hypothetical protein